MVVRPVLSLKNVMAIKEVGLFLDSQLDFSQLDCYYFLRPFILCKCCLQPLTATMCLERQQSLSSQSSLLLCTLIAVCELVKLSGTYAIRYLNNGQFPIDPTLFVVLLELLKAAACGIVHILRHPTSPQPLKDFNVHLLLPSGVYAITNNIFLLALTFVPPALWMILVQTRIPFTLLIYRSAYHRPVAAPQWIAAILMCLAIGLTQMSHIKEHQLRSGFSTGLMLALLNAALASAAGVWTEIIFKNPQTASIWQQQCQMYTAGAGFALIPFTCSYLTAGKVFITRSPWTIWLLLILTLVSSAIHGIGIALLVKRFDNVVKYHLGCMVHLLNSGLNHLLFPDKFSLTPHFGLSLLLVFYAIYMYENKTFFLCSSRRQNKPVVKHMLV
ncbi:UDP-galactose translocator 1-like [Tropilaelaps mercedesae]|uniref:UDP-galactose translocator 1-like n=1 Tax=Tropilaelaps mercedesae TaxID=418985 RepID=A0A1V9Y208_9ACAR|nr:UDP-galactose translocator 1-like [Tropilaelaps mercedesae]